MMRRPRPLDTLIAGLRGHETEGADWSAVIALANRTLLTPALCAALDASGGLDRLPADARDYLCFVHDRNAERNRRLRVQLEEAVAALNYSGIVPLLLKGAVPLFRAAPDRLPSRMTSDLDIGVDPALEPAARTCLEDLGYRPLPRGRGMARARDVGILEMRPFRPQGPGLPELVERAGCRALVPSVEARAAHWIVHDLLKEGDYWRGRIDLRHLHDLAELSANEGLRWEPLREAMPDGRGRNALDTQLCALADIFGVEVPTASTGRPIVRFQHWRRLVAARRPVAGAPVRLAGSIAWGAWRLSRPEARQGRTLPDLLRRIGETLLDRDLRARSNGGPAIDRVPGPR